MTADLDPQLQAVLDATTVPPWDTLSVDGARELHRDLRIDDPDEREPVGNVRDLRIEEDGREVPVRVYTPEGSGPFPIIVYYHGGGWVLGDVDTHDSIGRALTNATDRIVVSVDYRRAPEHSFPTPVLDAWAATRWVADWAETLGGDPDRITVAGDSAGGALAAAMTLLARDTGRATPSIQNQVLVYPVTDYRLEDADSYTDPEIQALSATKQQFWYKDHYTPTVVDRRHPYAYPLQASTLEDLPPALVLTCEYDELLDEGVAYAERLDAAGVAVDRIHYDDLTHGFFTHQNALDRARDATDAIADWLGMS